ncbi:hypothetical protein BX666DRAFT_2126380 [Dichotomocladium elegans]|nr:hypothetical protein BX666DRAFT_2126380 [Dichotomocladium elegans]
MPCTATATSLASSISVLAANLSSYEDRKKYSKVISMSESIRRRINELSMRRRRLRQGTTENAQYHHYHCLNPNDRLQDKPMLLIQTSTTTAFSH